MADSNEMLDIEQEIMQLEDRMREARRRERNIRTREGALTRMPQLNEGADLRDSFLNFVPGHMVPGNVGNLNTVVWPFWYETDFNFGTDPTILPGLSQTQSFQVSQEAAFILMAIGRSADAYSESGDLGPWQINIRDRQSSRQINDAPIPLQMIGTKSNPAIFPTPYLLYPNAFIDVTMNTWQTVPQTTIGSGIHRLTYFGYRVRLGDSGNLLSTVFSG